VKVVKSIKRSDFVVLNLHFFAALKVGSHLNLSRFVGFGDVKFKSVPPRSWISSG